MTTAVKDEGLADDGRRPRRRRQRDLITTAVRQLSGERRSVIGLGVLAVLAAQAESVALILIALIAETVSKGDGQLDVELGPITMELSIAVAGTVTIAAILVSAVLVFNHGWLVARVGARLEREDRDEIVLSYAKADWEFQSTQKAARVQGRLRLMHARARVFSGLLTWIRSAATIAVFILAAAVVSPPAALIIIVFGVALSLIVIPIRLRTRHVGRRTAEVEIGLDEEFGEAIDQGADVHVFGAWPAFISRFSSRSNSLQALRERTGKLKSLLPVVYQNGAFALILAVLLAASLLGSATDVGSFLAAALLLVRSVQYGQALQRALQSIAESAPAVEVLRQELEVPAPRSSFGERHLERVRSVELRDVEYSYPGAQESALRGVSLELRPGVIVGLAGPSGSGKSTLAQILLRLRWPTSGQYLVNGDDAAEYSAMSWARHVIHLPQEPHLLHASLRENVTYFDETISVASVEDSLRSVGLHSLVEALPDGLRTELGPSGRNLSGGQVQRVGIARALVRHPRLVVLDEPTSALDVNSERVIGQAISALRGDREIIVVVIAHRPSTLALCDEVVVLRDGVISSVGTADEQLAGGSEHPDDRAFGALNGAVTEDQPTA